MGDNNYMNLSRKNLPVYEFTKEGYEKILAEEKKLTGDRVLAVEDLAKARAMGDLSENGYYKAAREKLTTIDSRIRRVKLMIKYAKVIEKKKGDEVEFGSKVTIEMKDPISLKIRRTSFEIVGKEESNPELGKISNISPIGKALLGKKKGDKVKVKIPVGEVEYEVIEVE